MVHAHWVLHRPLMYECRNGSAARLSTTYRYCMVYTQATVGPPNQHSQLRRERLLLWYKWLRTCLTQHKHCTRRLTMYHLPTVYSLIVGSPFQSFSTLNFILLSAVSCASISSATCWPQFRSSSWNSVMFLFLATPLTAALPNLCLSVWGTDNWRINSKEYRTQQHITPMQQMNVYTSYKCLERVSLHKQH